MGCRAKGTGFGVPGLIDFVGESFWNLLREMVFS